MNRKNTGLSAFSFVLCVTLMVNLLTYGASHAASHSSDGSFPLPSPVSCASLTTLRSLASRLTLLTNSRTGDQLEYVVIGAPISTNCVPPHTGSDYCNQRTRGFLYPAYLWGGTRNCLPADVRGLPGQNRDLSGQRRRRSRYTPAISDVE